MKREFKDYRRIGKGLLGMSSLWLGKDHLVYVKGSGFLVPFTEEYHRYRYRDIQVISVEKTSRTGFGILLLSGFLLTGGIAALILGLKDDGPISFASLFFLTFFLAIAILFFLLLLRHLILGPTCRCEIQTSIKRERLRPLGRLHRAVQAIGEIEPHALASQVDLQATGEETVREQLVPGRRRTTALQVPFLVLPTFGTYAALGLILFLALFLESVLMMGLGFTILSLGSILLVASMVFCVRQPTPETIRSVNWILLGAMFFLLGGGAVYYVYMATNNPEYTLGLTGPLEAFASAATSNVAFSFWIFSLLLIVVFVVSLIGVFLALKWKRLIAETEQSLGASAEK